MDKQFPKLLVADDETISLKVIEKQLRDEDYQIITTRSGTEAMALLFESFDEFATVILDWMMPGLDGMQIIKRMKESEALNKIPVIFRTAKASDEEVIQGLQAGASFYLTKPCKKETMIATVKTAVSQYIRYRELEDDILATVSALELMTSGTFEFNTLEEARKLSTSLAKVCPDPKRSVFGLWELLLNAIEHGNLGISYEGKTALNASNEWTNEILRRQELPDNKAKKVTVSFENLENEIRFLIEDQGKGFDWKSYMKLSSERAFDSHGRGIAMANMKSFDKIDYLGKGNRVLAIINK